MCNAGTGLNMIQSLVLGLQGTGIVTNAIAANQEAKAYNKYTQAQITSTMENQRYQLRTLKNKYNQETEVINQERQNVYLQNLQSRATAVTSAADNGVEGSSLDSLFLGYERATAVNNYLSDRELRNKGMQLEDDADSLRASALSSINSLQISTNKTASTLLSGLGTTVSKYSESYLRNKYYNK